MKEELPLIDALRGVGLLQSELLRIALFVSSEGPIQFEGEHIECKLTDPRRRTSTLLAMAAGQSLQTVLQMAKLRGIPVRDTYPIARSAIETFINASYLLSEADCVSERAIRSIEYSAWKQANRSVGSGDYTLKIQSDNNQKKTLATKFPEFQGKGMGSWSSLDVPSKIRRVGELAGKRAGSRFLASYALIYSLSSEVIHGSPFGVSYFYTSKLSENPSVEDFINGTQYQLEDILVSVLHAACGYLSAFSEVQNFVTLAAAEQKIFNRLLEISTKDTTEFPQKNNVDSKTETSKLNSAIQNTCFVMGTQIHTDDGIWDIELIGPGDMVLSHCEETGELMYREVIRRFEHEDQETYCVRYENELGEMDWVVTTAGHPFWVTNSGWIKAIDLKEGDKLEICDPYQRTPSYDPEGWKVAVTEKLTRTWPARVISVENENSLRVVVKYFRTQR